jgi:hypothetical protein
MSGNIGSFFALLIFLGFVIFMFGNIASYNPSPECKEIEEWLPTDPPIGEEDWGWWNWAKGIVAFFKGIGETIDYVVGMVSIQFSACAIIPPWVTGLLLIAIVITIIVYVLPLGG